MTMHTADIYPLSKDESFESEALVWLPHVARFARALAGDSADADDLVQETFLRAYTAWDTYQPGTGCRSWLFTICRNIHLRTVHRSRRVVAYDDPEAEAMASAGLFHYAVQRGLDGMFDRIDLRAALERCIASLPDEYRNTVVLIDLEDCSYAQAATVLEIPVGTVRSRLFRGRRMLQEKLLAFAEDAGYDRARHGHPKFGSTAESAT